MSPAFTAMAVDPTSEIELLDGSPLTQVPLIAGTAQAVLEFALKPGVAKGPLSTTAVAPPLGRSLVS